MPETAPSRRAALYPWVVVGLLWFICFFNYADRVAISSILPSLEKEYGFSKTELGAISAAFTWIYAAASPFAGHVGDRYPRKWVILGGLYVWSIITGFTALCGKFWQFWAVRAAEGLGEAFYIPASMAFLSDYHSPKTRSRAIGLHQTSIYAGTIGGGALAGWMAMQYGWRVPFYFLGTAGVILGLVLTTFLKEPRRNQAEKGDAPESAPEPMRVFLKAFFGRPTPVLLVSAFFGANMVGMVFLTWMPTFLKEKFHLNLAQAGLGATIYLQLASMVGAVVGGSLGDRWVQVDPTARIRVQSLSTALAAPFIFLCGYTKELWWLVGAMTAFGFFKGMHDANLTPAFYDVVAPARRSTATGLMNLIGWIGAGLGSTAIGYAVDHGVTMSVAISSVALVYLSVAALQAVAFSRTAAEDIRRAQAA